jgi:DNA polymerase III delta prime subunit
MQRPFLAHCITQTLNLDPHVRRGIDVVRNKIKMFAQKKVTLPPGRHKIVILDEADRCVMLLRSVPPNAGHRPGLLGRLRSVRATSQRLLRPRSAATLALGARTGTLHCHCSSSAA